MSYFIELYFNNTTLIELLKTYIIAGKTPIKIDDTKTPLNIFSWTDR